MSRCLPLAILIAALLCGSAYAVEPVDKLHEVEYVRTIDGDTIVVKRNGKEEHVRLLAVDAPELRDGGPEGFAAAQIVAEILGSSPAIYLEFDPAGGEDTYGRQLAWVWWDTRLEDNYQITTIRSLLQLTLLIEGYAKLYNGQTSQRYDLLRCAMANDGAYLVEPTHTLSVKRVRTTGTRVNFKWSVTIYNPRSVTQHAVVELSVWAAPDMQIMVVFHPRRDFPPGETVIEFGNAAWPVGGEEPRDPVVQILDSMEELK